MFCLRGSQRECTTLLGCLSSGYLEFVRFFKGRYMVMDEIVLMINVFFLRRLYIFILRPAAISPVVLSREW